MINTWNTQPTPRDIRKNMLKRLWENMDEQSTKPEGIVRKSTMYDVGSQTVADVPFTIPFELVSNVPHVTLTATNDKVFLEPEDGSAIVVTAYIRPMGWTSSGARCWYSNHRFPDGIKGLTTHVNYGLTDPARKRAFSRIVTLTKKYIAEGHPAHFYRYSRYEKGSTAPVGQGDTKVTVNVDINNYYYDNEHNARLEVLSNTEPCSSYYCLELRLPAYKDVLDTSDTLKD